MIYPALEQFSLAYTSEGEAALLTRDVRVVGLLIRSVS